MAFNWHGIANAVKHEMFQKMGESMEAVIRQMKSNGDLIINSLDRGQVQKVLDKWQESIRLNKKEIDIQLNKKEIDVIKAIIHRAKSRERRMFKIDVQTGYRNDETNGINPLHKSTDYLSSY